MIDRTTEPPFNDRWQEEADVTWGDRPGIVASLLRYRMIVVAATLLGAVAGYGIAQLLPVRYQAEAVLIVSDPGVPSVLGGGEAMGSSDRQVYLDRQADIMTSTVVLERALELLGGAVLGGLVGLFAAGAWAWWAAAHDQRAEDRGEPARILEAPLLGEVPPLRAPQVATGETVTPPGLDPALEDAYHLIVASMEHELAGVGGTAIAVTSVGPGDNKTSTVLQIGNAASQQNREILLIDADLRLRHLSEYVGPAPVAAGRTSQQPRPRQRDGRGRWAALPRDEPVGAQDYLDRLVSTDSGMVLPVASNPTNPHRPPATDRAVDLRHALLHRRDVRPRPDRHTRPAGLLRRPHRGQTSRRSPTRRLPPGRAQRPPRRPRPPRLRQDAADRLRLHPTPQPRSPQEGRQRAGGTTLNEANGAATRVAALLAAYNRRTLTLACLHSLHAQRRPRLRRG